MIPNVLESFIKYHDRGDPIDRIYFACGYKVVGIYLAECLEGPDEEADTYPQCLDCTQPEIRKRRYWIGLI